MHGLSHLAKAQKAKKLFLNYYNPFNNRLSVLEKITEPSETLGSLRELVSCERNQLSLKY
jgi:hypothetical protein